MTRLFKIFSAAIFCAVLHVLHASLAFAADPFTVKGVPVDASASNAIEAQTLASQDGQLRAAQLLLERVTLETERLARPLPELTPDNVQRMIRAISVDNERRSANRYLGDLSVAFNPREVQSFLRANQLTLISSQARPRLIVPVAIIGDDIAGSAAQGLVDAFQMGGFEHALTPILAVAEIQAIAPDEGSLAALASQYGANQVLLVEASTTGLDFTANMTDITLNTGQSRVSSVTGVLSVQDLAGQIIGQLENDWKAASVTLASEATTSPVTVLYSSHGEWQTLQNAINTSAQIQDARLDALSKDGALMTMTFGNLDRLRTELQFKGVDVRQDPELGLVFAGVNSGRF